MTRPFNGEEIKVLDDGFVRFVDAMGSDESIVETARVSTGRGFVSWEPYARCRKCGAVSSLDVQLCSAFVDDLPVGYTCGSTDFEKFPRGDLGILSYMLREKHSTPFEFGQIILHIRMPMDAWRQHVRHRVATISEYSTRYSPAIDAMARTAPDMWRTQGSSNRQGSAGYLPAGDAFKDCGETPVINAKTAPGLYLSRREAELHAFAREIYEERLKLGVAKEQARKDLPLSNYTEAFWRIDLHNLMNTYLARRLHPHAQEEIRLYAEAIASFARRIWPRSMALFDEHVLGGVRLSRAEAAKLAEIADRALHPDEDRAILSKLRSR